MREHLDLYRNVLQTGQIKEGRNGVTIYKRSQQYTVNLAAGLPLQTTRSFSEQRWKTALVEFLWYLSGDGHVRGMREQGVKLWDTWATEEGHLETSYARMFRRYPLPNAVDPGERWPDENHPAVRKNPDGSLALDQIAYVVHELKHNPGSRRILMNTWHPANATVSKLPACPTQYAFDVDSAGRLHMEMYIRSNDLALGCPFDTLHGALFILLFAKEAGLQPGELTHHIWNAHFYAGKGARGEWYKENLPEVQRRMRGVAVSRPSAFQDDIADWIQKSAPAEDMHPGGKRRYRYDHVPYILRQMATMIYERPTLQLPDKSLDDLTMADWDKFVLKGYTRMESVLLDVAE